MIRGNDLDSEDDGNGFLTAGILLFVAINFCSTTTVSLWHACLKSFVKKRKFYGALAQVPHGADDEMPIDEQSPAIVEQLLQAPSTTTQSLWRDNCMRDIAHGPI